MTVEPDIGARADVLRDLAPRGVLRAAINFGNSVLAQRDAASGQARGISVDLARELGRRLGVDVELVSFDAAGKVVQALVQGAWDVAFLAIDPARATDISFTPSYVLIEGAYMVPANSKVRANAEVDRAGLRVGTGSGSAYELFLTRTLKSATIERHPTARAAFERVAAGEIEVAAGVRQVIERFAAANSVLRVLQPSFMVIEQAMGTAAGRVAGARYLAGFIEEMKASGFVAAALARSEQQDAVVAPGQPLA